MDEATNQVSAAADSDANTEQLRAEIEDTRADMSQTINEIQERLSPEHLVGQVKETVREATIGKVERVANKVGETLSGVAEPAREMAGRAGNVIKEVGTSVGNIVSNNPIPLALIGLGVGMLVMKSSRGQSYGNGSSSRKSLQGQRSNYAMGDVGQPRQSQQQTSGPGTLHQVKETASDLASRSTEAVSNFGTRVGEIMRDNPLACGAVAVAAGTAIGLVLPSTRFENEYIGETGERLVERVEDIARDALGRVQDAAKPAEPVTA